MTDQDRNSPKEAKYGRRKTDFPAAAADALVDRYLDEQNAQKKHEQYIELLNKLEGATIERVQYSQWEPGEWDYETLKNSYPVALTVKTKDGDTFFVTPMTKPDGKGDPAWLDFEEF